MNEKELSALMALRSQVEAMARQLDSMLGWQAMQADPTLCEHANREVVDGSTMGNLKYRCKDCGEEFK